MFMFFCTNLQSGGPHAVPPAPRSTRGLYANSAEFNGVLPFFCLCCPEGATRQLAPRTLVLQCHRASGCSGKTAKGLDTRPPRTTSERASDPLPVGCATCFSEPRIPPPTHRIPPSHDPLHRRSSHPRSCRPFGSSAGQTIVFLGGLSVRVSLDDARTSDGCGAIVAPYLPRPPHSG